MKWTIGLWARDFYLNSRVFLSRNYRLIVSPRKFDVLKTNIIWNYFISRLVKRKFFNDEYYLSENFPRTGTIDPLHKWRLNLNNNTLYILSLTLMFQDKGIFTWMRGLGCTNYCYSNLGAIYAKGQWADSVSLRMNTIVSRDQFKPIRIG